MRIRLLLCLVLLLTACASEKPLPPPPTEPFLKFPQGFLWGTATASYQIEGGITNNWTQGGIDAKEAVDGYRRYAGDYDQAKQMHTNAYRMSVEWARIEPEQGKYDQAAIATYRKMFKALRQRGIAPMVTIFHFGMPIWFDAKGGFTKEENLPDYLDFVKKVVSEFKDDVDWWNTVNEPLVFAFKSYDEGTWPPFQTDRNLAMRVARNLMVAHGKAYRAIHAGDPVAYVGYAHNTTLLQPNWRFNPLDQVMTNVQSYLFNEAFWDAIENGKLDLHPPGLEPIVIKPDADLKGSMDFVGINYYTRYMVTASGKPITRPGVPVTDQNWEIYPDGMLYVLRLADKHAKRLHIPIIITENGLADAADKQRPKYIVEHLTKVWQAIQEGIDVKGYFYWSLMDNFEWADGFKSKFGLLDRDRKWRPSGYLYQQIAKENGFPSAWLTQLPPMLPEPVPARTAPPEVAQPKNQTVPAKH